MRSLVCFALVGGLTLGAMPAKAKEMMEQSERVKGRSYSEAVITEGGRIVWLAGESTITDLDGKDIKTMSTRKAGQFSRSWIEHCIARAAASRMSSA